MTKEIKNDGQLEGCVYELFRYPPKFGVYRNSSDMNELGGIKITSK